MNQTAHRDFAAKRKNATREGCNAIEPSALHVAGALFSSMYVYISLVRLRFYLSEIHETDNSYYNHESIEFRKLALFVKST